LILQGQIAQFSRACWFDRAGLGWSDPSLVEQTSAAIAEDLHALLHGSGVAPPYVLVGASFSGLNVRVFSGKYPAEVAGVVLVDSAHEDQARYEPRRHHRARRPSSVADSKSPLRISATGGPSRAGAIPVASIRASQGRASGIYGRSSNYTARA